MLHRADDESAAAAANGVALPLRAPPSPKPPFAWQPSQEYVPGSVTSGWGGDEM